MATSVHERRTTGADPRQLLGRTDQAIEMEDDAHADLLHYVIDGRRAQNTHHHLLLHLHPMDGDLCSHTASCENVCRSCPVLDDARSFHEDKGRQLQES